MSSHDPSPKAPTEARLAGDAKTVVSSDAETIIVANLETMSDDAAADTIHLTPGTVIGGRYRIVALIGRGGMGAVYRADDLKLGQTVALKFLSGQGDAKRLYEEVRIGRQISHPNVCRLYDIAEIEHHLFITMEFVDGENLASLLSRIGRLPAEKALTVSRDICAGVAAAHEKGVMHRDLKPANVMIDGSGRARVTDFGLAVAGERATDFAGTPAYMSPEQLAGQPATARSDIYALGLVLYELFTGKRTFDATSTHDMLDRQFRGDFTRPSVITRDVPPAVERVIVRCLDSNPDLRPESLNDVLRELPGGDPLSAAVAAGETPSPAMVAAASDRGELSAPVALAIFAALLAVLVIYAMLTPRTMLYRRVPVKSPDVLQERISEVLAAAKQPAPRTDWSAAFVTDLQWLQRREGSEADPPILYLYRQSPRPLTPLNFEHRIIPHDPPLLFTGMADVVLESDGRLRHFAIVPPQHEAAAVATSDVDWKPFLERAAAKGPFVPARPEWSATIDSDHKYAWTAADGARIEAAAYHGKPVWFEVLKPWTTPWLMSERTETGNRIATFASLTMYVIFLAAAAAFAVRNLRRGQGDRRGAFRVAVFLAVVSFISGVLLAHHIATGWEETTILTATAGLALLTGAHGWLGYVAIEPLIRRRWPHMLIGETRLISGLARDPMVGRDVLIGFTAAAGLLLIREMTALLPHASPFQSANLALSGVRYVAWFFCQSLLIAVYGPIIIATLLVSVQAVTRNLKITLPILAILTGSILLVDVPGPLWTRILYGALAASVALTLLFRFGLLAFSAATFAYLFIRRVPVTLDSADWFFGRSTAALTIFIAIAAFGLVTSIGGRKWLPSLKFD